MAGHVGNSVAPLFEIAGVVISLVYSICGSLLGQGAIYHDSLNSGSSC